MATTSSEEGKARAAADQRMRNAKDPLEKLRYMIIARDGTNGINKLTKTMQPFDEDGDKTIDFMEFLRGVHAVGLDIKRDESRAMFEVLDRDLSGRISQEEFLAAIRPDMSRYRRDMVEDSFRRMDRQHRGYITSRDLLYHFDAKGHPDYQSGRYGREELERKLLKDFGSDGRKNEISREEFVNYFSSVSFAVERDDDFEKMVRGTFNV